MKNIKRILAFTLAFAVAIALAPLIGGNTQSYAANGTEYDQYWVLHATGGLHNGYCVAGTTIYVDQDQLLKDGDGPSPIAETAEYDPSNVSARIYYRDTNMEWDLLTLGIGETYATMEDTEVIEAEVPEDANENCDIKVEIHDDATGWYYESFVIPCRSRNVNADFMKDKGSVTITLPDKGDQKDVGSINVWALRNTMLIADHKGDISVTEGDGYDLNKDGKEDVFLVEDWAPDLEQYFWGEADLIDMGKETWSVIVENDQPFSKLDGFDHASGNAEATPYYSKIIFKFPKRSISKGTVKVKSASLAYNGNYRKPTINSVTVKGKTLKAGTDYTVSGSRKAIGQGKLTITGKGKYKGTLTKKFTVKPGKVTLKSVTGGSKKLTAKWGKKGGDVKYQVKYRVKGTSAWKNAYATSTSRTIKNLKKGKTYQVKVRAYKKVSGKTYYGAFSEVKSAKVK